MGSDKVKAYGAKGRDEFLRFDPNDVIIVGHDTPHKNRKQHPLWDERAVLPVNERLVLSMMEVGFLPEGTITVVKDGQDATTGQPIVYVRDGRQRTKALREANRRRTELGLGPLILDARTVKLGQPGDQMTGMVGGNAGRTKDDPVTEGYKAQSLLDAVREKRLTLAAAVAMEGMSQEEQKTKLAGLLKLGGGKEVDDEIEKTKGGRGRVRASMGRVRSRKAVETLKAKLDASEKQGGDMKLAKAFLEWFSGDDDALVEWPWLREALVEETKATKAKKGKKAK